MVAFLLLAGRLLLSQSISTNGVRWGLFALGIAMLIVAVLTFAGSTRCSPTGAIIQLFSASRHEPGAGTARHQSFYNKRFRCARNLNGDRLKVNDKRGNPIEIAAVVVWHVDDTAKPRSTSTTANFVKVRAGGGAPSRVVVH